MKTALVYARYSSERQTEQSIEGQIRVCNEYAERNDIKILDYYIDRAMTGTNDNRKDFQRLLHDCSKKICDYVLVYKLDRFSRNKYEMAIHRKTLRDYGIKILSAMENIPDSPEGIILESLLEGMAEYYSVELAQKVRRGQTESLRKGHWLGGQMPFGYKVVDKKLQIDENDAQIVCWIYQQYAAGVIVQDIIASLTARGILHKGKPFTRACIYYMLANEKYSGIFTYNGEVFDNICPRIVPDPLFKKVQSIMEKNKFGSKSIEAPYLLRGKVFCGYCGRMMNADSGTSCTSEVRRYYTCGGRKEKSGCQKKTVRKDEFEKLIVDTTIELLGSEENVSLIVDAIMKVHAKKQNDRSVLNILMREQAEVQKGIENILNAIQMGIVTSATKSRLEELEQRADEIKTSITLEQAKAAKELTRESVVKYLKSAIKKSPQGMLDLLINQVVLYDDKIKIRYNYTESDYSDGENQSFAIHGTVFLNTRHYKKNESSSKRVQLIPKWLLLSDSN